jgi:hypothetical protein
LARFSRGFLMDGHTAVAERCTGLSTVSSTRRKRPLPANSFGVQDAVFIGIAS